MRRARTIACPSCGARWEAGRARFCGWCGLPLQRPVPSDEDARPTRRRSRRAARAGGLTAAVAVVAAGALLADGFELPQGRPDPTVELADGEDAVVPRGRALSAEERAALLAPFDPNRLRCEPAGCEAWRHDLVDDNRTHAEGGVLGELVVVAVGELVMAYDAGSGEPRWRHEWRPDDGGSANGWTAMLPAADGDVLVLARPESGHLLALRADGSVAWEDRDTDPVQGFQLAGDTLLTSQLERPGRRSDDDTAVTFPSERVVARDTSTGTRLWERSDVSLMSASAAGAIVREGDEAVVLGLVDGAELARQQLDESEWLFAFGQVVLHFSEEGNRERILTPTLEVIDGLEGLAELQPLSRGLQARTRFGGVEADLLLGIRRDVDADGPSRVVLADATGRILWEVAPPPSAGTPTTCCPGPRLLEDALVLRTLQGGGGPRELWLDLDDGTLVEPDSDVARPPDGDDVWWLTPEVAIEQHGRGVRLHAGGGVIEVLGEGAWPLTDRPPFVFTNGRSLVGVQPVPGD